MKQSSLILLWIVSILLPSALAVPVKSSNPVHITSDEASFDSKTGKAIHQGNVIMIQSGRTVKAERLEVLRIKGEVESITATGNPATFDEPSVEKKPSVIGQATTIEYFPDKQALELKGNAQVKRSPDTFTGAHLTYNIEQKSVLTHSDEEQRSTFVIGPRGR